MKQAQRRRSWWAHEGLCQGNEDAFTADYLPKRVEAQLRDTCRTCPVLEECRPYAIIHEEFGFWAGMNRKQLKQARATELSTLGYRAVKEGWLEDYHLIPPALLSEFRTLAAIEQSVGPRIPTQKSPLEVPHIPYLQETLLIELYV